MSMMKVLFLLLAVLAVAQAWSTVGNARRSSFLCMSERRPFIAGNWKLNPRTLAASTSLASGVAEASKGLTGIDVAIFPPSPFMVPVQGAIKDSIVKLGGQNCYFMTEGAYTGAISTCMLKDIGASYVLAGHSERRSIFKDDDSAISLKVKKILSDGMKPVLCIGETQEEYTQGLNHEVCAIQLMKDLKEVTPEQMQDVVIAYEPVWSIGTGLVCPVDVAQEVHSYIRSIIKKKFGTEVADKVIIQYGGSVKPDNIKAIMAQPDIDGCLIGGASLTVESFAQLMKFQSL